MTVFSADVRFADAVVLLSFLYLTLNKFAYLLMRVVSRAAVVRRAASLKGGLGRIELYRTEALAARETTHKRPQPAFAATGGRCPEASEGTGD